MGTTADGRSPPSAKRGHNPQDLKEAQKRMRNRLSQKVIRERRSAYIEQLEAKVAFLSQPGSHDPASELWQRNAALQDSLHTLRKKLLSLSTTIVGLADNVLPILNTSKAEDHNSLSPPNSRPGGQDQRQGHSSDDGNSMSMNHSQDGCRSTSPVNLDFLIMPADASSCPDSDDMAKLALDAWTTTTSCSSAKPGPTHMALQDVADCPWGDTSFHVLGQGPSPSNNPASLPPDVDKELDLVEAAAAAAANADLDGVLPLISLSGPTMAQKTSNLSDHLQYVCDLIQLSSLPRRFSSAPYLINDLLHAVFHLAWPFMDYWITWTNSCGLITPIVWWQATRTEAARMAIAPIYQPTLLQMMTPSYPKVIDWVPHAALRDRLIGSYLAYDLDTMICHLTEAYVREPGVGESSANSFNVMDFVLNSLDSTAAHGGILYAYPSTASTTCSHSTPPNDSQMHRFKIDPSFVVRYPRLYHPSAVAKQPIARPVGVPKLAPPSPLTPATMQVYLNLLLQNKS